ncbi:AcrR family transcriptional regulator [Actinoplanes lutulentus]|uniref:TetR family transcriptional regulator n=1 Tax=Actinoplanes lutulentus TaxID=1287878 RepID=A0A327Z1T6_9ACTN|nr:TetR/AcrR family transcriptional regulator [Actinoplanes lutulentus]MBB2943317.1 AcrR family transcriptional regulator [Actinoplanes lutulentus]RAK28376.1 TetR family transcriptional regulator [Actinoplanes lutulentus]
MSRTGQYAKGVAKREEILEVALEIIAREGYHGLTIRHLADTVGLSKTGLLHYFGSKEDLFVEVLRRRDAVPRDVVARGGSEHFMETLMAALRQNMEAAGLIQLYVRFSAEATDPGHPAHEYFAERYRRLQDSGSDAMQALSADGRLAPSVDPGKLTVLLAALLDGMQLRSLFSPELDVAGHVEHFMHLMGLHAEHDSSKSE